MIFIMLGLVVVAAVGWAQVANLINRVESLEGAMNLVMDDVEALQKRLDTIVMEVRFD